MSCYECKHYTCLGICKLTDEEVVYDDIEDGCVSFEDLWEY